MTKEQHFVGQFDKAWVEINYRDEKGRLYGRPIVREFLQTTTPTDGDIATARALSAMIDQWGGEAYITFMDAIGTPLTPVNAPKGSKLKPW